MANEIRFMAKRGAALPSHLNCAVNECFTGKNQGKAGFQNIVIYRFDSHLISASTNF